MAYRVGLTGGVASGKSTIGDLFKQHNINVIDADTIARQLSEPNTEHYQQIVELFGPECLLEDKHLNRRYIRNLIFHDGLLKAALERILHPAIKQRMLDLAQSDPGPYVILMIPLLFETGMQSLVDRTVTVDTDESEQIYRLCSRDKISVTQAKAILSNQYTREQRLQLTDDIIDNSGSLAALSEQIATLHKLYLQLAGANK